MVSLWTDAAAGVRVGRLVEPTEVRDLIGLFASVAGEEGWQPGDALLGWADRSVYFAAELRGELVGGLQLSLPDHDGTLPCRAVWPEVRTGGAGRSAHVPVMALDRSARGHHLLFWNVAVEMWRHCVGAGIEKLYIEVTPRVLPLYRRIGWPLHVVGERRVHWGEDCYLCTLDVAEVAQGLLRRADRSSDCRQIIAQAFRVTMGCRAGGTRRATASAWC